MMIRLICAAAMMTLTGAPLFATESHPSTDSIARMTFHRATVDGVGIFYREAGSPSNPTIVLLHGFPSSSRQFNALIPLLATRYHLIAPDYPSFGQSDTPDPSDYAYTFDHLAQTVDGLLEQLGIAKYSLYVHDYGGPIGYRLMVAHPDRLQSLIVSNANAYEEGLGKKWTQIAAFWDNPGAHWEVVDAFLSEKATRERHTLGTTHLERYDPDAWTDEIRHLSLPGQRAIQTRLLYDYRTNVASYPRWQAWLREHQPPTLVVWGKNDPSFVAAGALAFARDVPRAEIHLVDASHWPWEEANDEVAGYVLNFMARTVPKAKAAGGSGR
ncbi:MAG: 4,5:9,10-diseco-3-hydroxy-5,9,17-trioxoandrosta-1(10),2-diene-4-oate hydrolase [Luteibacter sp.]|uniref:alpha/beta fold hydrolase n=1 Tax=Luteibacter sp. TaxID=1886636 RepID=UPI00137DE8E9|nr:alpha/beta hydrolase [Luteibacter sp.]KAF1005614.1 MAG: 4,5:9,10-diseco-3-hydroxy-5,9,17-trioxoandrosta-1(10),2-diene-4-oate hydrolase [Luteibacter sp.]